MFLLKNQISRSMRSVFDKMGTKFVWKGSEYPCSYSYGHGEAEILEVGYEDKSNITVTTLGTNLPTDLKPSEGDLIEIDGVRFLVTGEPTVDGGTGLFAMKASKPDSVRERPSDYFS